MFLNQNLGHKAAVSSCRNKGLWNSSTATAVRQPASETLWDQTRPFETVSQVCSDPSQQFSSPGHISRGEDVLVDDAIGDKDPRSEMKTAIQQYGLWNRFCQDMEESNVEKIWQESNHMKK